MPDSTTLERDQIRNILRRHRGSIAEVARRAGNISHTSVTKALNGANESANVMRHAEIVARELLAKEETAKVESGDLNGKSARSFLNKLRTESADWSQE